MLDRLVRAVSTFRAGPRAIAQWSLFATSVRRAGLGTKDGETGNAYAPVSLTEGLSARYLLVWDDGRVSRGALERRQTGDGAPAALDNALAAAFEDPDSAQIQGPAPFPDIELFDARVAELAGQGLHELAPRLAAVRAAVRAGGFRTWSGSWSAASAETQVRTSAGLEVCGRATSFGWHVTLDGVLGDGFAGRTLDADDAFRARLDRLARTAAFLRVPADRPRAGALPVVLHPRVVEEYVLGALLHNLEGAAVSNGESRFGRERFGTDEPVLRDDLTLRIDPLEPLRAGSYRFTSEGVPAERCTLVDRGRLRTPVLDLKYARRLGLRPTAIPAADDTVWLEGPPAIAEEVAWREADGGVLVLSVLGAHTQDLGSGDFSLSAPQALRLGARGPLGAVRGTLSGNLFETLSQPDLRLVRFEGQHTPGLLSSIRFDAI